MLHEFSFGKQELVYLAQQYELTLELKERKQKESKGQMHAVSNQI